MKPPSLSKHPHYTHGSGSPDVTIRQPDAPLLALLQGGATSTTSLSFHPHSSQPIPILELRPIFSHYLLDFT